MADLSELLYCHCFFVKYLKVGNSCGGDSLENGYNQVVIVNDLLEVV